MLLIASYNFINSKKLKDFPKQDVFNLNLSCEESIPVGKSAEIYVSFSNNGNYGYDIVSSSTGLFDVTVNDKSLTSHNAGTSAYLFSPGATSITYTFTPDKPGIYNIKSSVDIEVILSNSDKKKYHYEKSTAVNVTDK